jgi:hypothetical protein
MALPFRRQAYWNEEELSLRFRPMTTPPIALRRTAQTVYEESQSTHARSAAPTTGSRTFTASTFHKADLHGALHDLKDRSVCSWWRMTLRQERHQRT